MRLHLAHLVLVSALFVSGVLIACDSGKEAVSTDRFVPNRPVSNILSDTIVGTAEGTYKAARQPFEDIGIAREEIPPLLLEVSQAPYRKPFPLTCKTLQEEIAALDAILGADV